MTIISDGRVSPFGHPGIVACVPLPLAYRSLPRPSSPPCTQASPTYLLSLDQISVSKQNNYQQQLKNYNAQSTNESIFARFPVRLLEPERDEIESVLILDALRSYQVQEHRIPRSLLTSVVKQLAPTPSRWFEGRGHKMRSAGFDTCRTRRESMLRSRMIRDERTT